TPVCPAVGRYWLGRRDSSIGPEPTAGDGRTFSSGRYNGPVAGARRLRRRPWLWRSGPHVGKPLTRADDDDLASCVADDIGGHAAEHPTSDRTAIVAADDDQVRAFRLGSVDHRGSRLALPDEEL